MVKFVAELNNRIKAQITTLFSPGELMCGVLIHWLQDVVPEYFINSNLLKQSKKKEAVQNDDICDKQEFSRLWILSHHIKR